jgi:hypothetical protein
MATLSYSLRQDAVVTVEIVDALQRVAIAPVVHQQYERGAYLLTVPIQHLTAGGYSVRLTAQMPDGTIMRRIQALSIQR